MSTENSASRPRTEGGVWGSYVAYLKHLEALLRDVAASSPRIDDPRLSYAEVQLDVSTWADIRALFAPADNEGAERD